MTRMLAGIFAALGAVVALSGAQNTAPNKTPQDSQKRTYTGCLRPERFTRAAGSVDAKETVSSTFVLVDAIEVKSSAGTAARAAAADKNTYKLVAVPPGIDLKQLANHKVEVAGVLVDNPLLSPRATKSLNLQTLKDVSASCP